MTNHNLLKRMVSAVGIHRNGNKSVRRPILELHDRMPFPRQLAPPAGLLGVLLNRLTFPPLNLERHRPEAMGLVRRTGIWVPFTSTLYRTWMPSRQKALDDAVMLVWENLIPTGEAIRDID